MKIQQKLRKDAFVILYGMIKPAAGSVVLVSLYMLAKVCRDVSLDFHLNVSRD